jgi:creatinine amidohydrolase
LYSQIIMDVARSVIAAGFTRLFFLNGHGGNEVPAAAALAELVATDDRADSCYLTFSSWWSVGRDGVEPKRHGMATPAIAHACEYETSMVLYLRPELVKQRDAVQAPPALDTAWYSTEYGGRVSVYRRFGRLTASGSMGEPSQATAQKGESMFAAVVDEVVKYLDDLAKWPPLPVLRKRS